MLRASSLGLKCRRHAPFSSQAAVSRRTRMLLPAAGKAPVSRSTNLHKTQHDGHPGKVCTEEGMAAREDVSEVVGSSKVWAKAREDVSTTNLGVVMPRSPHGAQAADEDNNAQAEGVDQRLRETPPHWPLSATQARRTGILPPTVEITRPQNADTHSTPTRRKIELPQESVRANFINAISAAPPAHGRHQTRLDSDETVPPLSPSRSRFLNRARGLAESNYRRHRELLSILATTNSLSDAWHAYETLLSLHHKPGRIVIPWEYLHRLSRLIATTKPRTRSLFIRLLSVVSVIHSTGGRVQAWQWNALIDFAGKGWRRTSQEDFRNAYDVYNDMISGRPPGTTFASSSRHRHASIEAPSSDNAAPNIVTLTTLLNIAASTMDNSTMQFAINLHRSSDIPANRVTLLTYLRYFTRRKDLAGIRHIISQMSQNGYEAGLDGINAYLWAFAHIGRLDVASAIYAILRGRAAGDPPESYATAVSYLKQTEDLTVPESVQPDKTTYTCLLQAFAYHGQLTRCLQVFMDFINSVKSEGNNEQQVMLTMQMLPIYRAIFLGFARHGTPYPSEDLHGLSGSVESSAWSMQNLDALFADFLAIPATVQPSPRLLRWIVVAFARTSNKDLRKLQEVIMQLEERFPYRWGWRMRRLREKIYKN